MSESIPPNQGTPEIDAQKRETPEIDAQKRETPDIDAQKREQPLASGEVPAAE